MIERPMLGPGIQVEPLDDRWTLVIDGRQTHLLDGAVYAQVAPLIDGHRSSDDLAGILRDKMPAAEVYYALLQMKRRSLIREKAQEKAAPEDSPATVAIHESHPLVTRPPVQPQAKSQAKRLAERLPKSPPECLVKRLARCLVRRLTQEGLMIVPEKEADLTIVLTLDYLDPCLEEFNRCALRRRRSWLLLDLSRNWIGPFFQPGATGCLHCLTQRMAGHRKGELYLRRMGRPHSSTPPTQTDIQPAALELAIIEIKRWTQRRSTDGDGGLLSLDASRSELQKHRLTRRPQCPACGNPSLMARLMSRPLALQRRPKRFLDDGGYRSQDPLRTWKDHCHLASPLTGIVGDFESTIDQDGAVFAGRIAVALPPLGIHGLRASLRQAAGGKGRTMTAARTGALAEAVERYCGQFQGDEKLIRASYREMGERAIHPRRLLLFSHEQYRHRDRITSHSRSPSSQVFAPFDEERAIDWTPAWSLTSGRFSYLPSAYCFYRYSDADTDPFCRADSNGNAAGNNREEAILQGFLELVERDATALWWYNRCRRPAVDPLSFSDGWVEDFVRRYGQQGRSLHVLDLSSDLGIPVFVGVSAVQGREILLGFGAHLDPGIALSRALCEVEQGRRLLLPRLERSESLEDPVLDDWMLDAALDELEYLRPCPRSRPRRREDFASPPTGDLRDDVLDCLRRAERSGLEVFVVDLTRPDIGLKVVKVVVPGLRHFWARLAPGRLYDVPLRLGWISRRRREEELNPVPLFL